MRRPTLLALSIAAVALAMVTAMALPADFVAYPSQGQSGEQQQKDQEACDQWARQREEQAGSSTQVASPSQEAASSLPRSRSLPALPPLPRIPGLPPPPRPPELPPPPEPPDAETKATAEAAQEQLGRLRSAAPGGGQSPIYLRALAACMSGRGYSVK